MSESVKSFTLGKATITIINIGDIYLPMLTHMNVPASEIVKHDKLHGFAEQTTIPIQFFHIQLPHTSVLVDAGIYDVESDPQYAIPNYDPPPSLIDSLNSLGISPDDIDHVVITHCHWDHFNGTTIQNDGKYVPQFPNATYYVGRPDWDHLEDNRNDPQELESRTLQALYDHGVLELVDGDRKIAEGIDIMATPGETRGHQIVRIHSEGQTLYSLGDLYHHAVELDHPEWAVSWAHNKIFASRDRFMEGAIKERAVIVATHILEVGQLDADGHVTWDEI